MMTIQSSAEFNSIKTGLSIQGAPISVHWTFIALFLIHVALALIVYTGDWNILWYEVILYGPILFTIVLGREVAKAITTVRSEGTVDSIVLWPLGGLTIFGPSDRGPSADVKVAIVGALSHIPMALFWAILYILLKDDSMPPINNMKVFLNHLHDDFKSLFATVSRITFNWHLLFLLLHTSVPIYPLDGIRIWAGLLRMQGVTLTKTAKITSVGGMILSLSLFVFGVVKIFDHEVAGGITELLFGGFGLASSKLLFDLVKTGRLREDKIFGRDCYDDNTGASHSNGDVAMTPSTDATNGSDLSNNNANSGVSNASTAAPLPSTVPIENIESSEII